MLQARFEDSVPTEAPAHLALSSTSEPVVPNLGRACARQMLKRSETHRSLRCYTLGGLGWIRDHAPRHGRPHKAKKKRNMMLVRSLPSVLRLSGSSGV